MVPTIRKNFPESWIWDAIEGYEEELVLDDIPYIFITL